MSRLTKHLPLIVLTLALVAGCAAPPVSHIASGEVVVKERLVVDVATSWNQFGSGAEGSRVPTWTNEGIFVDSLQFYVGLKDGELIAPTPSEPKGQRELAFKSGMQPADVMDLFQGLWTRGGSTFTLDRIEPAPFMGGAGFRFEYSVVRKVDDVRMQGVAWGTVRNGELFLINYQAPRLAFFARYRPRVEAIAASARVRS
jgi:hypothetical protein